MSETWLPPSEVADKTGYALDSLTWMRHTGKIRYMRRDGHKRWVLICLEDVYKWSSRETRFDQIVAATKEYFGGTIPKRVGRGQATLAAAAIGLAQPYFQTLLTQMRKKKL